MSLQGVQLINTIIFFFFFTETPTPWNFITLAWIMSFPLSDWVYKLQYLIILKGPINVTHELRMKAFIFCTKNVQYQSKQIEECRHKANTFTLWVGLSLYHWFGSCSSEVSVHRLFPLCFNAKHHPQIATHTNKRVLGLYDCSSRVHC